MGQNKIMKLAADIMLIEVIFQGYFFSDRSVCRWSNRV